MKTMTLIAGILLCTLTGCGEPFSAGIFSEPGELTAGSAGDAGAAPAEAGQAAIDGAGQAGASQAGAGAAGRAGDPTEVAGAGAGSAGAGSAGAGAGGDAATLPLPIPPACGDEATEISGSYSVGNVPQGASCFKTKTEFNTVRIIACDNGRDVRVNGGEAMHCTSEPSAAWLNVCTVKGDFSGADADGYRYIQTNAGQYACGRIFLAQEPDGDPCSTRNFEYSRAAQYVPSDRVSAACDVGSKTCEWRCMSDACSGVSSPKAPRWELVRSCSL